MRSSDIAIQSLQRNFSQDIEHRLLQIITTLEDGVQGLQHNLSKIETRLLNLEKQLKGISQNLASAIENSDEDLTDLSRKVRSNEFAIESINYDLKKDIHHRLLQLNQDMKTLFETLERDIEDLKNNVAYLNRGWFDIFNFFKRSTKPFTKPFTKP